MIRTQIERILSDVIDARRRGDAGAVAKHFAADAVYRMSGTPDLGPITASHRGPDTIRAVVSHLIQTWDFTDFPAVSIHDDGATAYVYHKGIVRHVPSDRRLNFEILARVVFKGGLIAEFVEFLDTYEVARVEMGQR
jgi:ketosteroid isomerase-like protein